MTASEASGFVGDCDQPVRIDSVSSALKISRRRHLREAGLNKDGFFKPSLMAPPFFSKTRAQRL
jgi:hypothetical protein